MASPKRKEKKLFQKQSYRIYFKHLNGNSLSGMLCILNMFDMELSAMPIQNGQSLGHRFASALDGTVVMRV